MGRKAQPSVTSGGIGITQEVTNVGGVSVSAGVNVDITPVDFGINVNPSEGTVSVATGAEVPGGLLGISGGIEIDTNTGQVIGGSLGAEVGGLGINVSNSQKGGLGIEFTVQIPGTPIEFSLGFGFPPEPKPPEPTPLPIPEPEIPPPGVTLPPPPTPNLTCKKYFKGWTSKRKLTRDYYNSSDPIKGNSKLYPIDETETLEERLRELYAYLEDYTDDELRQQFSNTINNPTIWFTEVSRPVKYYIYSVGNGITFVIAQPP